MARPLASASRHALRRMATLAAIFAVAFARTTAGVLAAAAALLLCAPPAAQAQLKWGVKPEQKAASAAALVAENAPDKVAADRASAEVGQAEGQYALGARYLEGRGVPRDYAQARTWLSRAAGQNHAGAEHWLAVMDRQGLGGPVNMAEASRLLLLSANQGNPLAQFELAELWANGQAGAQTLAVDKEEALRWYRASGSQGNAEALYRAGMLLLNDPAVRKNDAEAYDLLQLSARRGNPKAMYNVSTLLAGGRGVKRDPVAAARYCRLAAGLGVVEAQYALGLLLLRGEGVLQDREEGLRWLRQASLAGSSQAKVQLAVAEAEVRGDKNLAGATRQLKQAAQAGDAKARLHLGTLYISGAGGLPKDPVQAYVWLELASQGGEAMAAIHREALVKTMSKAELARARDQVSALTPRPVE